MYQKDCVVIYGLHGVCRIADITIKDFSGQEETYYILKPIFDDRSTFFVPVKNDSAHRLRPLLSIEEVKELIKGISCQDVIGIEDEKHRKDAYKKIIESGDRGEMMRLIKTLYARKEEQQKAGKKQHIIDEHFMKEAESILYDEFAYVLEIKKDDIIPYIKKEMETSE
ncbi:MAG TPA: CarD family transcriptional regulator [Clostridiales bacterium]|nr:CarD family transcriptional regulator [Clostridiales bacterium]